MVHQETPDCPVWSTGIGWHLQQTLIDLPAPGFVSLRLAQSVFAAQGGSEVTIAAVSRLCQGTLHLRTLHTLSDPWTGFLNCCDSDQQVSQVQSNCDSAHALGLEVITAWPHFPHCQQLCLRRSHLSWLAPAWFNYLPAIHMTAGCTLMALA